jgi:hypothetical protein
MNPVGYPAELKNGVTVGTEGDPAREFGAASFDEDGGTSASVQGLKGITTDQAFAGVFKPAPVTNNDNDRLVGNTNRARGDSPGVIVIQNSAGIFSGQVSRSDGTNALVESDDLSPNNYFSFVLSLLNGRISLYLDSNLKDSKSFSFSIEEPNRTLTIGRRPGGLLGWDGEISAIGYYDLSVPNAAQPSEIARSWDRLTDIPATR